MGRVVKGAIFRQDRYSVPAPEVAQPRRDVPLDEFETPDSFGYYDELPIAPLAPPAPPPIDVEAVKAEAQALIDDAARNAEALLLDAHARARAMIEDASHRAVMMEADAKRSGHDSGFAEGRQVADSEMNDMLATMSGLLDMARIERQKLIEQAEPELVRLAFGIAERVLHQQVALDRGVVVEMARIAIGRLIDRDTVTVRVNPADLEPMREHRDELVAIGDIRNLRVVEDKRVDRGGVIVETEAGTIDARISTQLDEARKVLEIEDDVVVAPAQASSLPTISESLTRAS
jgi:flagellar assembly protein FliH